MKSSRVVPIALCTAVAVLEGFDIQAMGVAAQKLAAEFHFDKGDLKWLFSISNIGMVLGAALGGWLADRIGRKPVLMAASAMFGLFTLGTVVAQEFWSFFAARLLTGLGFGAALPNMMAIASELSLPTRRAATASLVFCGFPLGGASVALLTQVLPPGSDWRVLFIIGGVLPVLIVPALHWFMPETLVPREETRVERRVPPLLALFGEGRAAPTLLLWLVFFPTLLILYLMLNWLPTLVTAKGFDAALAPRASLAFNLASIAGALVLGWMVDRMGPRWPMTLAFGALMFALLTLASAADLNSIILLSGVAGFLLLGANYALYGVVTAYYPPEMRGTGSGASVAVGRAGSVVGPFLGGVLLQTGVTAVEVFRYLIPVAAVAGVAVLALSFFKSRH